CRQQKTLTDDTPKIKAINRKTPIANGKENPRASSAPRRNPAAVPAVRWSTSSLLRGKSLNPSDLNPRASGSLETKDVGPKVRVLDKKGKDANLKPNLLRRASLDVDLRKPGGKDSRVSKEIAPKSIVELSKGNALVANSKSSELNNCDAVRVSKELAAKSAVNKRKGDALVADSKSSDLKACDVIRAPDDINKANASDKPISDVIKLDEITGNSIREEKSCIKVFENSSENGVRAVNKYPSKLHEKLAALEGRVQRIASDIKRTKEMLDSNNNQKESKLILSDIQKKISGIENAVSSVVDGDGSELGLREIIKDNSLQGEKVNVQNSNGKGLKLEELEARFFPHQKLIKNRMALDGKSDLCKPKGPMSPIDENPIALEFLASLNTDQADFKKDCRVLKAELSGIREMGVESTASGANFESKKVASLQCSEVALIATEKIDDLDDQETKPGIMVFEDAEDSFKTQIFEIGHKSSTGGWFVSEGEAVLLTHNDGSCSYYDIANSEEKAEYQPPESASSNLWGDCWLIRTTGSDGCSGRFVVAASAGNNLESGFCSWDFYTKKIKAFHVEDENSNSFSISSSRTALAPLTNTGRRSVSCTMQPVERQWWYKPCGPLLISTASSQTKVSAYDIRDGELIMKWDVNSPVVGMEYSSPLQWRSRGKVIVAETEAVSLWDVNSLTPQPLLTVNSSGKKIHCLHVNNTDAEIGGGVRQRARSSEVEGNDGVFCTQESINVFDLRLPSGVGLKISKHGANAHSIYSYGDSIFMGNTERRSSARNRSQSNVQQFSLRKGKLMATYVLQDSESHAHHSSITQVWGNSNFVMGINGMGLSVFDAYKDGTMQSFGMNDGSIIEVKETIGPDDLYCPTFDYLGSRALVISRDRPAMWRYLL
ncbi:KIN14B-interacting protein At4g14310, partial [Asparagus officinalis]|uniref:KIN14B-interacting protein At4g14310 n=1 Tax=Asparagus officinalis TaxID=4686 RepID=UPI00098E5AEC